MEKKFKRTTVTSALPYANGPVHIGHLALVNSNLSCTFGYENACNCTFTSA